MPVRWNYTARLSGYMYNIAVSKSTLARRVNSWRIRPIVGIAFGCIMRGAPPTSIIMGMPTEIFSDLIVDEILRGIQIENARMASIATIFGEERARLIGISKWTKEESGLQVLNDVVHWLGFRNCTFNSLYHENKNRFHHANTTKSILDPNCNYPHP